MSDAARASVWVSASTVLAALVAWVLSFAGGSTIWLTTGRVAPWFGVDRVPFLWWQAVGMAIVFLLSLLAVRLWSAPPWLWLGALAASALLAGPYLTGYLELKAARPHGPYADLTELLYSRPFHDPYVALFALVGYPLAIGLGCWLGARLVAGRTAAQGQEAISHA